MGIKNGIDVSKWQGKIDWEKAKSEIDFAILRLGFGQKTVDVQAKRNISELNRLGIPYGVYWFSYAYTVEMARNEAKSAIAYLKELGAKLSYPVYFDWEYDSRKTAAKNGVNVSKTLLCNMATAFCEEVKAAGYYPGIYANPDYIDNHFGEAIFEKYDLWLAHYTANTSRVANIWQYSSVGSVSGIDGNVDMNRCMVDYPAIIAGKGNASDVQKTPDKTVTELAKEVIDGKWADGAERKKKLTAAGYDYNAVQSEVNRILKGGKKKTVAEIAKEVFQGKWGVGEDRKKRLLAAGYDYNAVQKEVNRIMEW